MAKEKPPIFGMIQRRGQVVIRMLEDVRQTTIRPGTLVLTDEYTIYHRLPEWGFEHQTVCHNTGE
ncbi:MAG: transposase [Candidatus Thiosymbion ectosymbiont of Robbea hypermnestra]|nr:transposase [Candidatus Thiosymbion ectosymbiont of Robbea hypermnestra]